MSVRIKQGISIGVLALAAALLAAGAANGGYQDVLEKARMICFECIGLA